MNMTKVEYSADFRAAVDGLGSAVDYAISQFREQSIKLQTQNDLGSKLDKINRLTNQIRAVIFPEMEYKTCSKCQKKVYVEAAFWQGICYECSTKIYS